MGTQPAWWVPGVNSHDGAVLTMVDEGFDPGVA